MLFQLQAMPYAQPPSDSWLKAMELWRSSAIMKFLRTKQFESPTTNQLTIRGFDSDLERSIRKLAAKEGISLNRAALRLLRRGAGLGEDGHGADVVGGSLDHLIGTWSADDAAQFDDALRDLSHVDKVIWE